jgi:diguanylate cyclase (GGDEF)-like protein/PAS domain S-box-containing protein
MRRISWGLIGAIVVGFNFVSYLSGNRYRNAVQAVEQTLAVEMAADAALSSLKDAETGQRGYLLTGDERFLEPYVAERKAIPQQFLALAQATRPAPAQAARVRQIERLTADKHAFIDETIRLRRTGGLPAALIMVRTGRGNEIMDSIRSVFRQVREQEQETLSNYTRDARNAQAAAVWGTGVGSVLSLLLVLFSFLTVGRGAKELRLSAQALAASEEHYRLLAEHVSDLVQLLDRGGGAVYVSPSIEPLLGYGVKEFMALPPLGLLHPDDRTHMHQFLTEFEDRPLASKVLTYRLRHKSGEYRFFEAHGTARRDEYGEVRHYYLAARDVTERKHAEEVQSERATELRSLSLHDELTGLYNRRGFKEVAGRTRDVAARDGRVAALIFVDLNGMKQINDELGHGAGDTALLDTARLLTSVHHEADVLARLGGDEFAMFCLDFEPVDFEPLRQRLRTLADSESARQGRNFRLSMSAGAAYIGAGSQESLVELVQRADASMYEAKRARSAAGGISIAPPLADV